MTIGGVVSERGVVRLLVAFQNVCPLDTDSLSLGDVLCFLWRNTSIPSSVVKCDSRSVIAMMVEPKLKSNVQLVKMESVT